VCTAYVHLSPSTSVARASADFPTSISNPFSPEHTGLRPPLKTPCTQVEVTLPPWLFLVQKPGNPAGTNRLEHRSKWKKTLAEGLVWGQSGSPKAPKALGVPDGALREMSEVCKSQEATGLTSVTRAPWNSFLPCLSQPCGKTPVFFPELLDPHGQGMSELCALLSPTLCGGDFKLSESLQRWYPRQETLPLHREKKGSHQPRSHCAASQQPLHLWALSLLHLRLHAILPASL
jgi:hypothetical protein